MNRVDTRHILRWLLVSFFLAGAISLVLPQPAVASEEKWASNVKESQQSAQDEAFQLFIPVMLNTPLPSSETLIRSAEERGEIDLETSLLYQFYAMVGDDRLPHRFRGDDSLVKDSQVPVHTVLQLDQLSPAGRQALEPFLRPPAYTDSWYEARRSFGTQELNQDDPDPELPPCVDLADGWTSIERFGFKVWLSDPAQMAMAEAIIELLNDTIRPKLHDLLGVTPLNDANIDCNGGSDSYDIYLLSDEIMGNVLGAVGPIDVENTTDCKLPTYMMINDGLPLTSTESETLSTTLAHEYMHTMQYSYALSNCNDYENGDWLEATAEWAIDFIYPDDNIEHHWAYRYLANNNVGYKDWGHRYDKSGYAAYLFPFYLVRRSGDASLIARIFEAWLTDVYYTRAVDTVIDGGFARHWPEFALYNLNFPPYDFYQRWDSMSSAIQVAVEDFILQEVDPLVKYGEWRQRDLDAELHRYALTEYEQPNGMVVFFNLDKVVQNESVQLRHFHISGADTLPAFDDLSDQERFYYCLEEQDPDTLASLFVLTNSDIYERGVTGQGEFAIAQLLMGCYKWRLQSHMLIETQWTDEEASWEGSIDVNASVIFTCTNIIDNYNGLFGLEFIPEEGQMEVSVRGELQNQAGTTNCGVDFTYPITPNEDSWLNVFIGIGEEDVQSGYIARGMTDVSGIAWRNCLGENEEIAGPTDWLSTREILSFEDGFLFNGDYTETEPLENEDGTRTVTHSWEFTALSD